MTERMSFRLSTRATLLALLLAGPWAMLAAWTWLSGADAPWYEKADFYDLGDVIYFGLGYPLTNLYFVLFPSRKFYQSDYWWSLPFLSLLFVAQWLIWAQLLALVWRALKQLCRWPAGGLNAARE